MTTPREPHKAIIVRLFLAPLVRRNYRLRAEGRLPDAMYWADVKMLQWGYWLDSDGKLKRVNL